LDDILVITPISGRRNGLLSRWVFAAFDAAATAGVSADTGAREEAPPAPRRDRYHRTQRAVALLARWVPGGYPAVHRLLIGTSRLPFRLSGVRVIGYGTAVTVFLLAGAGPAHKQVVLKVCRETLGCRPRVLLADARRRRATFQRVAGWYGDLSPLLPTSFLVTRCPLLSLPAVGCLQRYTGRDCLDPFDRLGEGEVASLVGRAPHLRRQLTVFVEGTARAMEREGTCVDLVGRRNLLVAGRGPEARLVLVDHGLHDLSKARPALVAESHRRLAYLQRLADQMEQRT
jgi:hypothetical protein